MENERTRLEAEIEETFEAKDELMGLVKLQAKLRILIINRINKFKKIPMEFVTKYNDTVAKIREIVRDQAGKEK